MRRADTFDDQFGGMAKVGQEPDVARRCPQEEADRVLRVVRHCKGVHGHVTDVEGCARTENAPVEFEVYLALDRFFRQAVAIYGDLESRAQADQPLCVVLVLVRDDNGIEAFRGPPDARQALADLTATETGVNEHARARDLEIRAIAARTAAKNGQLHRHPRTVRSRGVAGNQFPGSLVLELRTGGTIVLVMAQGLYLSQKLALQQVLAPQLQQSLALLQAPTLELKALVDQELSQNPVLEEVPAAEQTAEEKLTELREEVPPDPAEPPGEVASEGASSEPVDDFQAEVDKLLQLDQEWRDHFAETSIPVRQDAEEEERRQFMFDSLVVKKSLQEDLLEQLRFSDLKPEDVPVAEMIIGNIDDRGYLQSSVDELAVATNIAAEKILGVLKLIQTFDPPGVGARDLRECLLLQLERQGRQGTLEYRMVESHWEALGKRRFLEITRALGTTVDEVQEAAKRIALLEPRPGRAYLPDDDLYVTPEVFVTKSGDEYVVTMNNEQIPHLRISNVYKDMLARPDSSEQDREWIREKIRAGKFLIKSLHQRQQTILNIAREIVNRQREFMEKGVAYLKPLTMLQVADVVGVHETTVSRAVSGKYMQTPQGVFEMKYFFTSGLPTATGVDISNTSVKDMIAEMIRKEDSTNPLSDEQIVRLLKEKGIAIARRTVAKYRSELNILPSNMRRVY